MTQSLKLAYNDIIKGLCSWRLWLLLAWQDIRLRYRRSQLGPFWLTISMAINIYTIGFLYGHLFKMQLGNYFPFLAAGMLAWALISTSIIDCTNSFIEAEIYLKQISVPYSVFILRVICRNFIIFLHNIVVIIPILIYFHVSVGWEILLIIPSLLLIAIIGFAFGLLLAMLGARFRDIAQIIVSLVQVAFFVTPVMWNPSSLPEKYNYVIQINPFAQFVALIREPLLGQLPSTYTLIISLSLAIIGLILSFQMFSAYRKRIIYWL